MSREVFPDPLYPRESVIRIRPLSKANCTHVGPTIKLILPAMNCNSPGTVSLNCKLEEGVSVPLWLGSGVQTKEASRNPMKSKSVGELIE